jgi:rubrerythrin
LRSAGLLATLSGATPSAAAFSLFGRLQYAPMQISVPSKQAAEALRILAGVNEPPEAGWEDRAEQALDGWLCRNCDTVVDRVQSICPACGSHRDDQPTESDDEDRD